MINDNAMRRVYFLRASIAFIIYHLSIIISEKESFGSIPKLSFSVGVDGFEPPTLCL